MKDRVARFLPHWLLAAVLIIGLPAVAAALDPAAPPDPGDLGTLRHLGATLPPSGADQGDLLMALSQTAAAAVLGDKTEWKARDYDDLYALLQKYRDELREIGVRNEQTERMLKELQFSNETLEQKFADLKILDGLKFHGNLITYYDDVYIAGPGAVTLMEGHFRTPVQRAELDMTYSRGLLRGLVELDFQYIFGNQFDPPQLLGPEQVPTQSGLSQGIRQMYVELLTPVQMRLGTLDYRQTPLTFWRNEDPDPYVPEVFAERRQRLRDDLLLQDDQRQLLSGLRFQTDEDGIFDKHLVFSMAFSQLAVAPVAPATTDVGIDRIYQANVAAPTDFYEIYDTYVLGGQVGWRFPSVGGELGVQGTYLGDSPDSIKENYMINGTTQASLGEVGHAVDPFSNEVYGVRASLTPTAWLKLGIEADASSFSAPAEVVTTGTSQVLNAKGLAQGSAVDAHAALDFSWIKLSARLIDVSDGFTSGAAQGRTWDSSLSPMGPFDTENSGFDPQSDSFGELKAPRAPETIYNRVLLPPEFWYTTPGGVLVASTARIPFDPTVNSLDPYGDATPNRMRFGGGVEIDGLKRGVILNVDDDMASEITKDYSIPLQADLPLETINRLALGLRLDLKPVLGWGLRGTGSYTLQSVKDSGWVSLNSVIIQGGLEQDLWKGGTLQFGYRHLDADGALPYSDPTPFAAPDPALLAVGREAYDLAYDQWALGYRQILGNDLTFWANYGNLAFANKLAGLTASAVESRPNFQVGQGYARLTLAF